MPTTHFPPLAPIDIQKSATVEALVSTPATIGPNVSIAVAARPTAALVAVSVNQILPLAATTTLVEGFILMATKTGGADNAGIIFIGNATSQLTRINSGAAYTEQAPQGKKIDLNQVYVRIPSIGDGAAWQGAN